MTAKPKRTTMPAARRNVFGATLARLFGAHPSGGRRRGRTAWKAAPSLDPVMIAMLAIDRVGPATVRAGAYGIEVCVQAPDEAVAAVLRAALTETARRRGTDRLVRIVVE
jgi:hypothetical protein